MRHNLDKLYKELVDDWSKALVQTGREIVSEVRRSRDFKGSVVKNDTSFTMSGPLSLRIWNRNPIAFFLEYGTTAHEIVPRYAARLRFTGSGGRRIVTGRVNHPGNRAYGTIGNAVDKHIPNLIRRLTRE